MSDEGSTPVAARPRHSRGDVVEAALRLLREGGLAELSMRNIAAQLGVRASALYWHFPDKQSLLAAVSDALLARVPVSLAPGPWRERVREEAKLLHGALMGTRDGAELVASTVALGLGERTIRSRLLGALRDTPPGAAPGAPELDPAGMRTAAHAIEHLLIGHAMHWQQRRQAERLGLREADPRDEARDFTEALDVLITGIAASFTRGSRSTRFP